MKHLKHSQIAHLDRALDSRARELRQEIRDLLLQSDHEHHRDLAGMVSDEGDESVANMLADLDAAIDRSSGFFVGRPAVLDLGNTALSQSAIALLIQELEARHIRIMGIEGAEAANLGPGLPPVLVSGRPASGGELARVAQEAQDKPASKPAEQQSGSLVVDTPVRSGQTIYNSAGDVVVVGSVAWGAEVVASGSVHIYGVLRGRALAGATGNTKARIFCRKLEAELLAIAGYYRTVDDIESNLRNRPVQAWLDGNAMLIAALD